MGHGIVAHGSEEESMFVIKYKAREAVSNDGQLLTPEGKEYWVVGDDWGPTSSSVMFHQGEVPDDVIKFKTKERAERFMTTWDGHPWYHKVRSYEILEIEPVYAPLFKGWSVK